MLIKLKTNKINFWLLLLIIIGVLDTSYLTASHYFGDIRCLGTSDCDQVLLSPYSTIAGIPLALFGLIYYLVLTVFLFYFFQSGDRRSIGAIVLLSGLGLIFSAWLVYLQYAVITAWCSYCLLSALTTTLIFIYSLVMAIKFK